ncbi:MAG: hypothetical protein GYA55_13935 [SAR324 cluster bacterium]|uniref:Reverse transcriptase domain-containing protein n=1 Tax=SAR324 cluster bacterium TaxID=2024889 RepID=A0A7X9ILK5_9DELT|nr:hypothetical protein [SAR324 cluster bacterium]
MKRTRHIFDQITSIENIFLSWFSFRRGKRQRLDMQMYERHLEDNLFLLHTDLRSAKYRHGEYSSFTVHDPKCRIIRKATIRDRFVHHLVHEALYTAFDSSFIAQSFSARRGKGTHAAVSALQEGVRRVSCNFTRECWALQCDVCKFYNSVNHVILGALLKRRVLDARMRWLLEEILASYYSDEGCTMGLPIGNVTSQLFGNIYLNELDHFAKHVLKVSYYYRYADNIVLLSAGRRELNGLLPELKEFLREKLNLRFHENEEEIRPLHQGIDFLGYVIRPHHLTLRTSTKKRMFRRLKFRLREAEVGTIKAAAIEQSLASYQGLLKHANCFKLSQTIRNLCFMR